MRELSVARIGPSIAGSSTDAIVAVRARARQSRAACQTAEMGTLEAQNRQIVERYWEAHFARDWERMATFFAADAHYTDVGLGDPGAIGPDQIIARLKLGIEPLERYHHHPQHMIAEGDLVVTEHVEEWLFHTGENVMHPFVSVMEVRERFIVRWHDYSHLQNLTSNAPAWWLEHIGKGWRETAPDA